MKITKKIRKALREVAEELNATELAKRIDVNKSTVSRWLTGEGNHIADINWEKLQPLILPHLDIDDNDIKMLISNAEFISDYGNFKAVPLITMAAAKSAGALVPTVDGVGLDDDKIFFPNAQDTDVGVKIQGDSMSPWYPDGTLVLVSTTQWPVTGDRVVVQTEDGEILFKVFIDEGDKIRLMSVNRNNGEDMIISKRSEIKVYPIKMSLRDEHKLDDEMKAANVKHFWEK
jgi:SOS-response transcriptional repressor LexA